MHNPIHRSPIEPLDRGLPAWGFHLTQLITLDAALDHANEDSPFRESLRLDPTPMAFSP
jgi:hypothetical protein